MGYSDPDSDRKYKKECKTEYKSIELIDNDEHNLQEPSENTLDKIDIYMFRELCYNLLDEAVENQDLFKVLYLEDLFEKNTPNITLMVEKKLAEDVRILSYNLYYLIINNRNKINNTDINIFNNLTQKLKENDISRNIYSKLNEYFIKNKKCYIPIDLI